MPVRMAVNVDGRAARRALGGLKGKLTNLDPVRHDFGEYMVGSVKRTFAAGGRPRKWKPSLRALATGGKTLIQTARLKNSITSKVRAKDVLVGTNVAYGAAHQFGVDKRVVQQVRAHARRTKGGGYALVKAHRRRRRLRLAKRPFLKVQREDQRYLNRRLLRHFDPAWRFGR